MNWKEKKERLLKQAREIATKCEAEDRDFTSDERQKVANMLGEAKECDEKIEQQKSDDNLRQQIDALSAAFDDDKGSDDARPPGRGKTLGERFTNAKAFQAWMQQMAPNGHIPPSAKGIMSPPVEFKNLLQKDLITGSDSTDSAGVFVQPDYTGIYEPLGRYALNVLDLVAQRQTTSDTVHFVRQTVQVQQAEPVPEAEATDPSDYEESGEKPEGRMEWEQVTENVRNIAVWVPATKRALSDAAQLRGLIDQELRADLMEELEDQIVNGDGTGENFTGIHNTAGILSQAWDTDLFTTTRKAITTVEVTGRARPNAWVMHPEDWETIELETDSNGRYYYAGPQARGPQTHWGLPVVTSQTLNQGTALLADWNKAVLWDREQASIQVSDSHEDFFIRNMVAILAEMRAAFALIRPSAFCEITMESGS